MAEPNRCIDCGKPIPANQIRCHECHADYWLDDVMEGESWDNPPPYDDGDYDDFDEDDYDE
jgi:hypothetical protein